MAALGKMLIGSCIASGKVGDWLGLGSIEHLFKPTEVDLYVFVREHVKKYGALPQADTIEAHLSEEVVHAPEPPGYYYDLLQSRFVEQELKRGMKAATEKLAVNDKDPMEALRLISEAVMSLMTLRQGRAISDFRDAHDEIVADYVAKYTADEGYGLRFGWPSVDDLTGGLVRGDMASMVGRPAMGKTQQLLYAAHSSWSRQKVPQLFFSMEMKPLPLKQRLAAMQAKIPAMKLKNAELSTQYWDKLKTGLVEVKGFEVPFWIVDGNLSSTVEEMWMLARQLDVGGIWVDGGYLVKHPRERDRFKRVAENAELMKQMLSDIAPTTVSWQFAKPKSDGKKKAAQGLDDIGYTDAIAQVSSLVLGMLAPDSADNANTREIDILKGRNGETGKFRTHWDWISMDFSEVTETPLAELSYV